MFQKLDELTDRYRELSEAIAQPEIIRDFPRYQQFLKERAELEPIVLRYGEVCALARQMDEAQQLLQDPDFAEEAKNELMDLRLRKDALTDEIKLLLIPPDPMDSRNVIMEIRAGVGGEEAALFAADLLRMYQKYTEKAGLKASVLSLSDTDLGGINEALVMITGPDAYARMKYESGVHCVKRVPVTESGGRIHTSTVTVAVLPEAEDVEFELNPADLRIDVFHASGHGGQGVNTTDSAVRVTHLPTGTVVSCQDERSQLENTARAIKVLRSRLLDQLRQEQIRSHAESRKSQIGSGDRSERIRTYYFNHDYVVDHRIAMTVNRTANVMNGEIGSFIDALRLADKTSQLNG